MKNIFNKTNAPYLVAGALATLALVSSGVVGVLTAVAVFNASLPLIAGLVSLAVFSAATIAFSAVMISKNNLPDVIELPEISSAESQPAKEENVQGWGAYCLDKAKTVAKVVVGGAIVAAAAAPILVGTLFTGSSASPAGDMFNSINGTYSCY